MSLSYIFDREKMYIYPWYISDLTVTKDIADICDGLAIREVFVVIEKDLLKLWIDPDSSQAVGQKLFTNILNNQIFFNKIIKKIYKAGESLSDFCQRINELEKINELNNQELLDLLEEYITKLRRLRKWGWVPVLIDALDKSYLTEYIQNNLSKFLDGKNLKGKTGKYYSLLSSSERSSELQTEELARLDILLKILQYNNSSEIISLIKSYDFDRLSKKFPEIYKLLDEHIKEFGWLTYAYSGPIMSINHLVNLLLDGLSIGDIAQNRQSILDRYQKIKIDKSKLIEKLSLPEELVYAFEISSELMFIKDYRKGIYQKSYVTMDRVLSELAKRLNLSLKQIKYLVFEEIKEALNGHNREYIDDIVNQRLKKCCYSVVNGEISIWQGEECDQVIKEKVKDGADIVEPEGEESLEIKGMIAYSGKITGIVKIIQIESDIKKMNKGDILVSSSTNPDLIVAMKKASAFVTDVGGIVSHAAIISRELKKPCIVGTRNATHLLKDGDKVEVNADNGIVRIIKKA